MQLSPFLSLCRSIDRSHASSLWKQRWLFAIVATMRADIGFREKERPFRGRRGRKALRELYVPLIATRRCRRRRRRLPPPSVKRIPSSSSKLGPRWPRLFRERNGGLAEFRDVIRKTGNSPLSLSLVLLPFVPSFFLLFFSFFFYSTFSLFAIYPHPFVSFFSYFSRLFPWMREGRRIKTFYYESRRRTGGRREDGAARNFSWKV